MKLKLAIMLCVFSVFSLGVFQSPISALENPVFAFNFGPDPGESGDEEENPEDIHDGVSRNHRLA